MDNIKVDAYRVSGIDIYDKMIKTKISKRNKGERERQEINQKKIEKILEAGLLKITNPKMSFRKIGKICEINHITAKKYLLVFSELLPKQIRELFLDYVFTKKTFIIQYKNKSNYKWHKEKIKNDLNYRLRNRLRKQFHRAFQRYTKTGKVMPSKKYGVNYQAIIEHLKPFPKNLSKYHIDHIKPLCSFTFVNEDGSTNLEEVKKAFAPSNHQWLTAKQNMKKGGRFVYD